MIKPLYCVFDSVAHTYLSPFLSINEDTAKRDFSSLVMQGNNPISEHPSDFRLEMIGTFNDDNGVLVQDDCYPLVICYANEFLKGVSNGKRKSK